MPTQEQVNTVAGILDLLPRNDNPFAALRDGLRKEFFPVRNTSLTAAVYAMLALSGAALVGSIVCLVARFTRGDRWLFRLKSTSLGVLITPNMSTHFLLFNCIYIALLFPFVLIAYLRVGGDNSILANLPFYLNWAFLALFLCLWGCAWSTTVSAVTMSSRTSLKIPPIALNGFFTLVAAASVVMMVSATAVCTVKWQNGLSAFRTLDSALRARADTFEGVGVATTVTDAIPDADRLVRILADELYKFSNPFQVCASLAVLLGIVMALGGGVQCGHLYSETKRLSAVIKARKRVESMVSEESRRASMQGEERPEEMLVGVVATLKTVLLTTVFVTIAALGFVVVCFVGNLVQHHTDLFLISSSYETHTMLFLFFYSWCDAIVVGILLFGTFDPATKVLARMQANRASMAASSYREDTKADPSSRRASTEVSSPTSPILAMKKLSRVPVLYDDPELDHPSSFPPDLKYRVEPRGERHDSITSGVSLGFSPLDTEPSPAAFFGPPLSPIGTPIGSPPPPASPSSAHRHVLPAYSHTPMPPERDTASPYDSYSLRSR